MEVYPIEPIFTKIFDINYKENLNKNRKDKHKKSQWRKGANHGYREYLNLFQGRKGENQ